MEIPLLRDILVVFSLSIFVLFACLKLKIPTVVGFLLTGVIAGPGGLGLVRGLEDVEILSHLGIILLLFTVGLEFSLKKIMESKGDFFISGFLQVLFTVIAGALTSWLIGRPVEEAFFLGFILSLSSTAIVIKLLQDHNQTSTPHGKAIIGILIFQDVIAIPMMLIIPLLAGQGEFSFSEDLLIRGAGGLILLCTVFYAALSLMPRLFDIVTQTRSRELFLMTVLVTCFAVAYGALQLGLTLSIGAFMAGLILSESEYGNEAFGDIIPFRDLFTSFFFISIGMLCDLGFVAEHPFLVVAVSALVLAIKSFFGTLAVMIRGLPLRNAIITGCALAGIGEFSFVLAKSGFDMGIGSPFYYQLFLAVSLLTMALTPLILTVSEKLADHAMRMPLPNRVKSGLIVDKTSSEKHLKDHVVILGFGITGRNLARVLKQASIPYVVIEMNSETVKREKKNGEPMHYGDATHESVLKHVCIHKAKVLAVSINDPVAALRATEVARKLNLSIYIISRTRRVQEMPLMAKMGASEVIPDEFGTSVEIFTRVLRYFQITEDEIGSATETLREEGYNMLRSNVKDKAALKDFQGGLDTVKMETLQIESGSKLIGKSLKDSGIRHTCGVSVMLIRRGDVTITHIEADLILEKGDRVVVLGNNENLSLAKGYFKTEKDLSFLPK